MIKTIYSILWVGLCCRGGLAAAGDDPSQGGSPAPHCEIALVSPVSGHAECVKPPGAPVDPPPERPPLTPQECREHRELELEECRQIEADETPGHAPHDPAADTARET